MHHCLGLQVDVFARSCCPIRDLLGSARSSGPPCAHRDRRSASPDTDSVRSDRDRRACDFARSASAIGLSRILPSVPSRRGADANSVANTACTASTTPTWATNRREPVRLPSSTPQNTFNRALTRSTAVRPLYIRSNFLVARGSDGNRRGSTSRGTRTVLPYDLPALQIFDIGHSQPSCFAGQRYFSVSRSGFVTDVGHLVSHGRFAHFIITIDCPVFVVHDVRGAVVARQHPLRLGLPQCPHLDQRRDPFAGEHLVHVFAVGRLVVGQGLDPIRRQVRLGLLEHHRQRLAVAGLGVGDLVGQHHLVLDVHDQVELEAEPLDHLGHLALVVLVFLAAAAGLRQSLVDLLLGSLLRLAPRRQTRGVTGGVAAQVGDRQAEMLDFIRNRVSAPLEPYFSRDFRAKNLIPDKVCWINTLKISFKSVRWGWGDQETWSRSRQRTRHTWAGFPASTPGSGPRSGAAQLPGAPPPA